MEETGVLENPTLISRVLPEFEPSQDMTLRNFAPRTIEVYVERVVTFAEYFHTSPKRLGPEHIRGYLMS